MNPELPRFKDIMDHLKTILVANTGEIACRLINAAKKLEIRTIAIYTTPDCESEHVRLADIAVLLDGEPRAAYIGFLFDTTSFARAAAAAAAGLVFVGPSPEPIESFGLKHTARDLAVAAGVPVVPGTQGLLETEDAAVDAANGLGYPVMLKATAGGGGMGLLTCSDEEQVHKNYRTVQSRGESLFKNAGVFLERYYPDSHHIEVQVFGDGMGKAISIGEHKCSIQRRRQKVIEECPSPFVELRYPGLRERLTKCAVSLAESIKYGSAGTMNTRLQVEHGITEMCYGVDLVDDFLRRISASAKRAPTGAC
ncbi:carbamoyl-phosphate synthase L chain, ATP binding domain-containing protein [Aspergillus filifer]